MLTFLVKMRVYHTVGHFARKRADWYDYTIVADDSTDAAMQAVHLVLDEADKWNEVGMKIAVRDMVCESIECLGVTVPA